MSRAKDLALEAVGDLPESCSMDDVLDTVYRVAQVLEGLEDAEAGRLISTEQLITFSKRWRGRFEPADRDDDRYRTLAKRYL